MEGWRDVAIGVEGERDGAGGSVPEVVDSDSWECGLIEGWMKPFVVQVPSTGTPTGDAKTSPVLFQSGPAASGDFGGRVLTAHNLMLVIPNA